MTKALTLRDRRFGYRFMGRAGTWLWLLLTLGPGIASWVWAGYALRGFAGDERIWFLYSGNVVLGLFLLTLGFVLRKWSVKLKRFRDLGRASAKMADASWAEVQAINKKIQKGAFANDAEILAAANDVLRRFQVERIERAEIQVTTIAGKERKYVRLRKREPLGRLEPWLEMHMGVGVAACVGVWFHADGVIRHPIGWILFIGSMIVLVTGLLGAVLYRVLPEKLAKEGTEIPYEEAGVAREGYEACLAGAMRTLDPAVQAEMQDLFRHATSFEDLRKRSEDVLARSVAKAPDQADVLRDVIVLAGTRDYLLRTTAAARSIDFQLKLWRWIHVPVSVFLFFVIALHVWVVFWY
jgi:hypothetical protein